MIPVNEPLIGQKELKNLTECVKTGWISAEGRFIEEFEKRFSEYCGMKYGVAMSNGTVALQIAAACLDLKPGDEVIIPSFTIISCAQAVIYNRGIPSLVDSESRTWTIDTSKIEEKITERTKAIMSVHIYGHPVDMDPIFELAEEHNLAIIEDAAEAHGAEYKGRKCGSLGDISCFSFYANKIITTGEGGMVLTNNEEYVEKARSLRNLAFREEKRFYHTELGHNFRMTNLQAAVGVAQMERIEELIEIKRRNAALYTELLEDTPGITLPIEESWARNVYWMYGIVLEEDIGMDREEFSKRLHERGIMTRPFFHPMHQQPVFNKMGLYKDEQYPVAERIGRQGLYLPSGLTLKEKEIEFVCNEIKKLKNKNEH